MGAKESRPLAPHRHDAVPPQSDPNSWLSYGKNYAGWRYSELTQINTANVSRLAPVWILQSGRVAGNETTPLVYGGMMYLTGPSNHAWALDLRAPGSRCGSYRQDSAEGLGIVLRRSESRLRGAGRQAVQSEYRGHAGGARSRAPARCCGRPRSTTIKKGYSGDGARRWW